MSGRGRVTGLLRLVLKLRVSAVRRVQQKESDAKILSLSPLSRDSLISKLTFFFVPPYWVSHFTETVLYYLFSVLYA